MKDLSIGQVFFLYAHIFFSQEGWDMKKRIAIALSCLLASSLLLGLAGRFLSAAVPAGQWGLHFNNSNVPQAPASREDLEKFDAYYMGDPQEKVRYLTFDAGYENGCTEQILDILKKHQVSAAFFLTGHYLNKNADLVRRMVEEGHIVGNHTVNHPDMAKAEDSSFADQLSGLETLFKQITEKDLPKYYRPPQGSYSPRNLEQAQELGYATIFWSLAYADWDNKNQPDLNDALDKLLRRTHNGAIVLLHSTSQTNAKILDQLLTRWKDMGYRLAPLTELHT